MTPEERALRERLHAQLVAPETPGRLVDALDELAEEQIERGRPGRWATWRAFVIPRQARLAVVVAVVAALVAGSLLLVGSAPDRNGVAASPGASQSAVASQGLATQAPSSQPSSALPANPVVAAAWLSTTSAWAEVLMPQGMSVSHTTDGGGTWSAPALEPRSDAFIGGLDFLDASFGYMVATTGPGVGGDMTVSLDVTRDGGLSWSAVKLGTMTESESQVPLVHFSDARHGVVLVTSWVTLASPAGQQNQGFQPKDCAGWTSDDGGQTWSAVASAPCAMNVEWATPTTGIAFRAAWPDGGRTAVTRDGGRTWTQGLIPGIGTHDDVMPYGFIETAAGVELILAGPLPRTAPSTPILESVDNGATWRATGSWSMPADGGAMPTVLSATDWLSTGFVRTGGGALQSVLLESLDGGTTWERVAALPPDSGVEGWLDRQHGVLDQDVACQGPTGSCGALRYLTSDGGLTWTLIKF